MYLNQLVAYWYFHLILTLFFMFPVQCVTKSHQRQGAHMYSESNIMEFIEKEIEQRLTVAFENSFEEMIQKYRYKVTTLEKEMLNLKETNNRLEMKVSHLSKEVRSCLAKQSHKIIEPSAFTNNMQANFNFSKNENQRESSLFLRKDYLSTMKEKTKEDSHLSMLTATAQKGRLFSATKQNLSHQNINNRQKKTTARGDHPSVSAQSARVAFTAYKTRGSANIRTGSTLKFDALTTNIGSGYNVHTGTFTCPVAGTYVFYHNLEITGKSFTSNLMKNGVMIGHNVVSRRGSGSDLTIVHLNQGDTVCIETAGHIHVSDVIDWDSTFSGFLLY